MKSKLRVKLRNPETNRMKYYDAKKLAILKWEMTIKNNRKYIDEIKTHPLLSQLKNSCAYCHLFIPYCINCPLYLENIGGCIFPEHPYTKYVINRNKRNAQKVLDLIINS
jgi:hypothetical protein